jgi:hypothetical protein
MPMSAEKLFYQLLMAEEEVDVLAILGREGLLESRHWRNLGNEDNNFSVVGNQHSHPTGAIVEKVINAIDAVLMVGCYTAGIEPEGPAAPKTMAGAAELFYNVPNGRLGSLTNRELTSLAESIQVVATGSRASPSYLIVDRGEGQTPASFQDTFLSLAKSNKIRIAFVQGKFDAGGTGVLQFCGTENLELIVSRRAPEAPAAAGDPTSDLWGFTVIRRLVPEEDDSRRTSRYIYLAPEGEVPSFAAKAISALPSPGRANQPAEAYKEPLAFGTVIKLYNYGWKTRSIATTDARFELEKYLHSPSLPFRVTETRNYKANFYSTTVSGIWASIDGHAEGARVEEGYPASGTLAMAGLGSLRYRLAVFGEDVEPRRVPHGVFLTLNGQVHGALPADYVGRRLEFEWIRNHLLVSVDCTNLRKRELEDLFPAGRDRVRQNEVYDRIVAELTTELKAHPGLRAINAARRAKATEKTLSSEEDVIKALQQILNADPSLRSLFGIGERLVTRVGPTEVERFRGVRFPTFFRLAQPSRSLLVKHCPINRTCRVDFETDAVNDYFDRDISPGTMAFDPAETFVHGTLFNGVFHGRVRPIDGCSVGDELTVTVTIRDEERDRLGKEPFVSTFVLLVEAAEHGQSPPGGTRRPKTPDGGSVTAPRLAIPHPIEIRRDEWKQYGMDENSALIIKRSGKEGEYDFILNLDSDSLLGELRKTKEPDQELVTYWYRWGLVLSALGILRSAEDRAKATLGLGNRGDTDDDDARAVDPVEVVNSSISGVARVIIPIIRTLSRGPSPS